MDKASTATKGPPRLSRPRFAAAVLLGVYPLITLILYVVTPATQAWAIWQRTLVIAPLMVSIIIWGLIPAVHRLFGRFIHLS